MKGLLTATPHVEDEVVVGEVMPFPVNLLHDHDADADGTDYWIDMNLWPEVVELTIEDQVEFMSLSLTGEQGKRLHDALGVALYGR